MTYAFLVLLPLFVRHYYFPGTISDWHRLPQSIVEKVDWLRHSRLFVVFSIIFSFNTVLPSLSIFSFTRMRQSLYKDLSKTYELLNITSLISLSIYIDDGLSIDKS